MCRHSTTVSPSLLLSSLSLLLPFVCSIQGERVPVSPLRSIPLCCKSWTWHGSLLWSQKMMRNCLSFTDGCLWLSIVAIPMQSQLHRVPCSSVLPCSRSRFLTLLPSSDPFPLSHPELCTWPTPGDDRRGEGRYRQIQNAILSSAVILSIQGTTTAVLMKL